MRTLKLHFANDALPTLNTFLKETKEARIFRRAQAVRDVVKGQRLQTVSDTLHFTYSALRKWVYRFASQGTQGHCQVNAKIYTFVQEQEEQGLIGSCTNPWI